MIWREKKRLVDKYSNQDSKTDQFLALGMPQVPRRFCSIYGALLLGNET